MSDTRAERAPDPDLTGVLQEAERALREALEFYADENNWTQPTPWGGRILDDESEAIADQGSRARAALAAAAAPSGEGAHKTADYCAHCGSADGRFCADPECPAAPSGPDEQAETVQTQARNRAASLQEKLGIGVSASTSNGWIGAYAIVDFDGLERLASLLGAAPSGEPPSEQEKDVLTLTEARLFLTDMPMWATMLANHERNDLSAFASHMATECAAFLRLLGERDAGPQPPETT